MSDTNWYKDLIFWAWKKATKEMIKLGFGWIWMKEYIDDAWRDR